jgi:hypothetical protein
MKTDEELYKEAMDSVDKITLDKMDKKLNTIRKNEIKKMLYKNNPIAFFDKIRLGVAYYSLFLGDGGEDTEVISFEIPVTDMGEADFTSQMQAKYLIRWLA